jgi:hypothetical protein
MATPAAGIASAAHDQKAIDYLGCFGQRGTTEDKKHSPFAEALFAGLRGAADTIGTGDGIITAFDCNNDNNSLKWTIII